MTVLQAASGPGGCGELARWQVIRARSPDQCQGILASSKVIGKEAAVGSAAVASIGALIGGSITDRYTGSTQAVHYNRAGLPAV